MFLDPLQRDFSSYDRLVDGVPVLNRDSPQAQGIQFWLPGNIVVPPWDATGNWKFSEINAVLQSGVSGFGKCWEGNGTGHFAVLEGSADGNLDFGPNDPFTIAFWTIPQLGTFIAKAGSTLAERQFQILSSLDNFVVIMHGTNNDTTFNFVSGGGPYHIVVTHAADRTTRAYVDGVQVDSWTGGTSTTNNADVILCSRRNDDVNTGYNAASTGHKIWDVGIWNRVFSPEEVRALYDPATRWDLHARPRVILPGLASATPGSGSSTQSGGVFAGARSVQTRVIYRPRYDPLRKAWTY